MGVERAHKSDIIETKFGEMMVWVDHGLTHFAACKFAGVRCAGLRGDESSSTLSSKGRELKGKRNGIVRFLAVG